ncbi:MAG: hypothetical protein EZS28_005857 [Streblomastix strix]|uniref:Uncharacterized protein n=1 Tax=Streblomastix strix TaxID=222440 RepID=A0A5J4WVR6_9EUKA|nr:MAG: hypothetical protein EZS28_005857 [Streblomastix strix]
MRNEEKRNETVNCLELCIQSMQKTSALCKLSKDQQRVLDGLDRCDAKLDVKNAGIYPYRDKKKPEHYDDYVFYLREAEMPIFEPLTANITISIDALESLNIDWKSIWKTLWEAAIKYACESKICH